MRSCVVILASLLTAGAASAHAAVLQPALQGIGFLVGHWSARTPGKVAETGGSSTGEMDFIPQVSGSVLLRKDHVSLFNAAGKPTGTFDIMMMIYPEAGTIHAEYADGDHIIHYTSADVDPGRAITFTSTPTASLPTFKLAYRLAKPDVIDIAFSMAPPGSTEFHPIATGSATKDR